MTQAPPPITFEDWKESPTEEGLVEFTVSFPSAVVTEHPANANVPLRIILPEQRQEPVPSVLILHYWGARDLRLELALGQEMARNGIAAVIVTLPYHLGRTPAGKRSGELAVQPDPEKLVATMEQSVADVRRTVDFIQSREEFAKDQIGIAGTSLGSLVASLTYAVEPRISRAAFILGGVDYAHIMWHSSRVVQQRDALRNRGFTEARLREALKSIEPLTYLSQRQPAPTFVIGGRFDTVIPPVDTQKLINVLPNPKVLWLDTGHYGGIFVQRRILKEVAQFFVKDFKGEEYKPPSRVYAPTLRLVVQATTESGFQVGVGLDIWRANARGDVFSSLIATPRGPQLFLGVRLDKGLAIGGFASPKKISAGAFWSTVL